MPAFDGYGGHGSYDAEDDGALIRLLYFTAPPSSSPLTPASRDRHELLGPDVVGGDALHGQVRRSVEAAAVVAFPALGRQG